MARIDILMPQMGESITEGTVSKWLKKVGDAVQRDESLFEISTDKVDAEIPSPSAGVLVEIKVQEGQTVAVQTLVAVLETDAAAAVTAPAAPTVRAPAAPAPEAPVAAAQRAPAAPGAPGAAAAPTPTATPVQTSTAIDRPGPPSTADRPRPSTVPTAGPPDRPTADGAAERLRTKSTPLVRKIAAEHKVDISTITGSGIAGRVTKQDILGFIESGPATTPAVPTAPTPSFPRPSSPVPASSPDRATVVVDAWPGDRVEPFSKIRKITAEHMVMSRRISAHVTSFFEVDYTHIAELRGKHKAVYAEKGANLTYLAFIAKACADMLKQHPVVNAAVSGETIIYRRDINIGIAVALDWGLIVPVVKHADELSLIGLARAIKDLGERARTKKLLPDEVQRGTFTITNPGVFGSFAGAPIINQPQVAILGVGGIEKRPRVVTLPDGSDTIVVRTMGIVSISYDHRVVDGADADRFLADVKKLLQEFPEGSV